MNDMCDHGFPPDDCPACPIEAKLEEFKANLERVVNTVMARPCRRCGGARDWAEDKLPQAVCRSCATSLTTEARDALAMRRVREDDVELVRSGRMPDPVSFEGKWTAALYGANGIENFAQHDDPAMAVLMVAGMMQVVTSPTVTDHSSRVERDALAWRILRGGALEFVTRGTVGEPAYEISGRPSALSPIQRQALTRFNREHGPWTDPADGLVAAAKAIGLEV